MVQPVVGVVVDQGGELVEDAPQLTDRVASGRRDVDPEVQQGAGGLGAGDDDGRREVLHTFAAGVEPGLDGDQEPLGERPVPAAFVAREHRVEHLLADHEVAHHGEAVTRPVRGVRAAAGSGVRRHLSVGGDDADLAVVEVVVRGAQRIDDLGRGEPALREVERAHADPPVAVAL
jgi:hypothetical protein